MAHDSELKQLNTSRETRLVAERFKFRLDPVTLITALPFLIIIVTGFLRQGLMVGLSAVTTGLLIAILLVVWTKLTQEVVLGFDYVRIRNGWRVFTYRRSPQPASLLVSNLSGQSVLYLYQEKHRAKIEGLSSDQTTMVCQRLSIVPEEVISSQGWLRKSEVSDANYAALPYSIRHPWIVAIVAVVVLLVTIVPSAI